MRSISAGSDRLLPAAAVVLGLALAGCSALPGTEYGSVPGTGPVLDPAAAPDHTPGDTLVMRDMETGVDRISRVIDVEGREISGLDMPGQCGWTVLEDGFAPALDWTPCNGAPAGTQTVALREGGIFPMKVGSREVWDVSGTDRSGASWTTVRTCVVTGTAQVTVPAGTYDTYVVRCEDDWWVRTYYHAPVLGANAIRTEIAKDGSAVREEQLVSYQAAI